jgi:hypothetical protein
MPIVFFVVAESASASYFGQRMVLGVDTTSKAWASAVDLHVGPLCSYGLRYGRLIDNIRRRLVSIGREAKRPFHG